MDGLEAQAPRLKVVHTAQGRICSSAGVLKTLAKPFDLRCKVGIATDPVGRVLTCQDPDIVVRLGSLRVSHSSHWVVASNSLIANLGREHVFR